MSDIKLPMMKANTNGKTTDAKTSISASALYKYLGWSKSRRTGTSATTGVLKNGVPLLMYLDIFKNFFANTQENKFYMLKGGLSRLSIGPNNYKIPAENFGLPQWSKMENDIIVNGSLNVVGTLKSIEYEGKNINHIYLFKVRRILRNQFRLI